MVRPSKRPLNAELSGPLPSHRDGPPTSNSSPEENTDADEIEINNILKAAGKNIAGSPVLLVDTVPLIYNLTAETLLNAIRAGADYRKGIDKEWSQARTDALIDHLRQNPGLLNNLVNAIDTSVRAEGLSTISFDPNRKAGAQPLPYDVCLLAYSSDDLKAMQENVIKNFTGIEQPEQNSMSPQETLRFLFDHEAGHCKGDPIEPLLKHNALAPVPIITALASEAHSDLAFAKNDISENHGKSETVDTIANIRALRSVMNGNIANNDISHSTEFELDKFQKKGGSYLTPEQVVEGTQSVINYLEPFKISYDPLSEQAREIYGQLQLGLTQNLITDEDGTQSANGRAVAERFCKAYEYFMPKDAFSIRQEIGIPDPEAPVSTARDQQSLKAPRSVAPAM